MGQGGMPWLDYDHIRPERASRERIGILGSTLNHSIDRKSSDSGELQHCSEPGFHFPETHTALGEGVERCVEPVCEQHNGTLREPKLCFAGMSRKLLEPGMSAVARAGEN
jgi:hypothetical protein